MRSPTGLTHLVVAANVGVVIAGLAALFLLPTAGREADQPKRAARKGASASPLPSSTLPEPVVATVESAREVKANELGVVPVIMYHRLLRRRLASIDRTPSQVRAELEKLAKAGYTPITAAEYVSGKIDIPAGSHPVVLTFDDGNPTHFALDARGLPKKDTATGILFEVAAKYPSFRPVATFWVNRYPFGLRDRISQEHAIYWLVQHGSEVANHTYSHPDLRRLSKTKVKEEIARQERLLEKLGAGPSKTFALPYGSSPRQESVAHTGSWDGTRYDFDGVFMAGAYPSISPYSKDFDRYDIPRIQSNDTKGECRKWCSTYWLEWLAKHPRELYTADGDPHRVSMPKRLRGNISAKRGEQIVAY